MRPTRTPEELRQKALAVRVDGARAMVLQESRRGDYTLPEAVAVLELALLEEGPDALEDYAVREQDEEAHQCAVWLRATLRKRRGVAPAGVRARLGCCEICDAKRVHVVDVGAGGAAGDLWICSPCAADPESRAANAEDPEALERLDAAVAYFAAFDAAGRCDATNPHGDLVGRCIYRAGHDGGHYCSEVE